MTRELERLLEPERLERREKQRREEALIGKIKGDTLYAKEDISFKRSSMVEQDEGSAVMNRNDTLTGLS